MTMQPDQIIIYNTIDGRTKVQLVADNTTVWLTQKQMAELFDVTPQAISHHIREITRDGELGDEATFKQLLQQPGQPRSVNHYNLEMVLAVGYRIRGPRGIQFRTWATTVLREFLEKGFTLDDQRLKNEGDVTHFDELLERIREIRTSERMFWRKITDVIKESSEDYNPKLEDTRQFFASIQNKLHFAVHGKTAAELILERANHAQPTMGLQTWSGDAPHQADVVVAKNYLNDPELDEMKRLVSMYLDYAEDRAKMRKGMLLSDWKQLTDKWLVFNDREVLTGAGSRSKKQADNFARSEWTKYQRRLDAEITRTDLDALSTEVKALKP